MKTVLLMAGAGAWLACSLGAQPAPAFEVASIKPAGQITPGQVAAGKLHIGMNVDGARVDIGNLSLSDLIRIAFRVKPYQVAGPDWMSGRRFDVLAKLPEGASAEQVPEMLQALLAERFALAVHRENREQPVYALVVGKGGPKLKEAPPDENATAPPEDKGQVSVSRDGNAMLVRTGQTGPMRIAMTANGTMRLEGSRLTLAAFAEMLGRFVDRPVVDLTELKGSYQMALDLSMDDLRVAAKAAAAMMPGMLPPGGLPERRGGDVPSASDPSGGSIFSSVQQLGLRLEPRKLPVETIVVDHLEKTPGEN